MEGGKFFLFLNIVLTTLKWNGIGMDSLNQVLFDESDYPNIFTLESRYPVIFTLATPRFTDLARCVRTGATVRYTVSALS